MTTYNSYEAAKIANPESDIFTKGGLFCSGRDTSFPAGVSSYLAWTKCDPADHCVTVEKFLVDGYKFVDGDLYLNLDGHIVTYKGMYLNSVDEHGRNDKRYILRAAALETKEPKRTKIEHVQEKSFKEVLKCAIDGEVFYPKDGKGEFKFDASRLLFINHIGTAMEIAYLTNHEFYRRTETPIEWWEDAKAVHDSFKTGFGSQHFHRNEDNDTITISGEYTREQLCDMARELLEQGE